MCNTHCEALDAAYMSLQYGRECWCSMEGGLDYERHGEGVCEYPCTGDENESCGGYDAFDLYR